MDNWFFWLFILGAAVSPFIPLAGTIRNLLLGWRIPTRTISALPEKGWVEVVGRIKGEPIQSLLSQSECAYWQLDVRERQSRGRGGSSWQTIYKKSSGEFEVDDMTGRVKILDGNFDIVLSKESPVDEPDEATKSKLEALGVKTKGFLGIKKKLRIYERLIAPGEEILVVGKCERSEGQITMSANTIKPLLVSNLSKAEMLKIYSVRTIRPMIIPLLMALAVVAFAIFSVLR